MLEIKTQVRPYTLKPTVGYGTGPVVCLMDRNSASASEILAGALKAHGQGKVVGETSVGEGDCADRLQYA